MSPPSFPPFFLPPPTLGGDTIVDGRYTHLEVRLLYHLCELKADSITSEKKKINGLIEYHANINTVNEEE